MEIPVGAIGINAAQDPGEPDISESATDTLPENGSRILGELTEKRAESEKHFLRSDGSMTAVEYSYPVHHRKSGETAWIDIDNTLQLTDGSYAPRFSPLKLRFGARRGSRDTVTYEANGYTLSWKYE